MTIKQTMWIGACAIIGWNGMGFLMVHAVLN